MSMSGWMFDSSWYSDPGQINVPNVLGHPLNVEAITDVRLRHQR
jgi:hypothetical protein